MTTHAHSHEMGGFDRAFAIGAALNIAFVAVEAWFGLAAHSLALIADAGHNLSDVLGLLLAWGAVVLTRRKATARRTYGLGRTSILAALANGMLLLIAVGAIVWEAIRRFGDSAPVESGTMILVALAGIVINGATALLLRKGGDKDLNVRGAFLHMAADTAVSAGVVVAGIVIRFTGAWWIDPAISLVVSLVIVIGTWSLLRDSMNLALDAVPASIDLEAVRVMLSGLPGVRDVHDLHIWATSTVATALTAHLVVKPEGGLDDELVMRAAQELKDRFAIPHATIQLETRRLPRCADH